MASRRNLYQTLATESVANARWFLADAKRLRRVGSRGHAAAFAVLSIEESSKALIYREAAEGVLRIVQKKPNHITTFTENELLNHLFKQRVLANAFGEYLRYGPFYEVAEGLRKPKFSKSEVQELFLGAVHAHRVMQINLQSGGRATQEVQRLGNLLDRLNDMKNRGLYVDHSSGRILTPMDTRTRDLGEVLGLAENAIKIATESLHRSYSDREKQLQREANKAILSTIRRAQRRTVRKGKGPAR
jgi:AbiV family abortive infection protein